MALLTSLPLLSAQGVAQPGRLARGRTPFSHLLSAHVDRLSMLCVGALLAMMMMVSGQESLKPHPGRLLYLGLWCSLTWSGFLGKMKVLNLVLVTGRLSIQDAR